MRKAITILVAAALIGIFFLSVVSASAIEKEELENVTVTIIPEKEILSNLAAINYTVLTPLSNLTVNITKLTPIPLTPIPTLTPAPTITPTPTVTPLPTPVPIKKPQLEAIYELHPGKTKGEIEIKIYIRNIGDVNASNVKFEIDNPRFLNPTAVAGCYKLGDTIVVSSAKLEPHEELVGSYSVTVPTDRDTEIRGRLSYTDESGLEEIVCIIIIKILEALFAEIPMLGIGATLAAFGTTYLIRRRR
jgi:hypothetical protein